VIEVARLGHADHRLDDQVRLDLLGRPQRQLLVRAVHRVAGLERHHAPPAQPRELGPQLRGREPQRGEVVVRGEPDPFKPAADVVGMAPLEQVGDAGVVGAAGPEDLACLALAVGLPDVIDVQHGQHHALGIAQRNSTPPGG
jgi:hypothetical protein